MADFCQQCCEFMFGGDTGDLRGNGERLELCEGCGEMVPVDSTGKRIDGKWLKPHSAEWKERLSKNGLS